VGRVLSAKHHSHAAGTDLFDDAVMAKNLANCGRGHHHVADCPKPYLRHSCNSLNLEEQEVLVVSAQKQMFPGKDWLLLLVV
jgi:hypothetical protein